MKNPFSPPDSHVADIATQKSPNWARTLFLVAMFSGISLALSWFVAPFLAGSIALLLGIRGTGTPPSFLAIDLVLSLLAFMIGCYFAARLSRGHLLFASGGVAFIGWLVYFFEAGGIPGMLNSQYPVWYEFFPSHLTAGLLAGYAAHRQNGK